MCVCVCTVLCVCAWIFSKLNKLMICQRDSVWAKYRRDGRCWSVDCWLYIRWCMVAFYLGCSVLSELTHTRSMPLRELNCAISKYARMHVQCEVACLLEHLFIRPNKLHVHERTSRACDCHCVSGSVCVCRVVCECQLKPSQVICKSVVKISKLIQFK